jgi:UPF0755 protein
VGLILMGVVTIVILLSPVSKSSDIVEFTVKKGEGKEKIVDNLKDAKLIKSKYATFVYIVLSGKKNLQAGSYEFSRNMSVKDIITSLSTGDIVNVKKDEVRITFKEGDTLKKFVTMVANETNIDYDGAIKKLSDKAYLKGLIADYWFLTDDILDEDIYFPLEGYLYPETYNFYKETSIEQVIRKVLNVTNERLEPIKSKIENSKYNIHELLTIASIAEKEANTNSDRAMVTQVIYKRLGLNMALGMDVTSYYGVQKEMTEAITQLDLNDKNPYNTRVTTFIGLPVGPICNPSIGSINAALEPADTDYLYFVADINTGKVYFAKTNEEFNVLVKKYVKQR